MNLSEKNKSRIRKMDTTTIVLAAVVVLLLGVAFYRSRDLPATGLLVAGQILWRNLPILLLGFAIAGLVQVLIPRAAIASLFGANSGVKGVLLACLAGGIIQARRTQYFRWLPVFILLERGWGKLLVFSRPGRCGRSRVCRLRWHW